MAVSAGDWLPTWGREAAPLGHGEAGLQPEVGRGVTGARAPPPLWNRESTYGPTVTATAMAPRSKKKTPRTSAPSKYIVFGDETASCFYG